MGELNPIHPVWKTLHPLISSMCTCYILVIYSNLSFSIIVNLMLTFVWKTKLIMIVHWQWERTSNMRKCIMLLHLYIKKKVYGPFLWPLVLTESTSEGWKVKFTMGPTNGFELWAPPRLGIQHLAIASVTLLAYSLQVS